MGGIFRGWRNGEIGGGGGLRESILGEQERAFEPLVWEGAGEGQTRTSELAWDECGECSKCRIWLTWILWGHKRLSAELRTKLIQGTWFSKLSGVPISRSVGHFIWPIRHAAGDYKFAGGRPPFPFCIKSNTSCSYHRLFAVYDPVLTHYLLQATVSFDSRTPVLE